MSPDGRGYQVLCQVSLLVIGQNILTGGWLVLSICWFVIGHNILGGVKSILVV